MIAAPPTTLPLDADQALKLAAQTLFDVFANSAMGTMVLDREHRIVWISEGYKRFLPALAHAEADFVGRRVEEVVPNTLMAHVIDTGQPILVDLLSNQAIWSSTVAPAARVSPTPPITICPAAAKSQARQRPIMLKRRAEPLRKDPLPCAACSSQVFICPLVLVSRGRKSPQARFVTPGM